MHPIPLRLWPILALLATGLGSLQSRAQTSPDPARTSGPPNIVLILADDLGYGDLSSYGAEDLRTPHLDSLIAAGMRFERFYANSPVCSPTRAALLSGRWPDVAGVPGVIRTHARNSWGYLSPDVTLLPRVLKGAGYHTALVGKWHLGLEAPNRPLDRGFDVFRGFLGDMMDDYYTHRRHGLNYMREGGDVIDPEGHATDLFSRWAADYVREQAQEAAPFFLYLAYNAPHTPIQPPEAWTRRVLAREAGIDSARARLVALIEHMDAGIGEVVAALKETGAYENTLLVFTSDNGGQLGVGARNGPLRGGKQEMYEGGLRVPAGIAWPQRIEAGARSDAVLSTVDLYPTLAEAAGADVFHAIDGVSFLPLLLGGAEPPERPLFFVRREGGTRYMGQSIWAVRRGDWKLLQNTPFEPFELYHLADDPQEQRDLSASEPEKFNELARLLRAHVQQAGAVPWQDE